METLGTVEIRILAPGDEHAAEAATALYADAGAGPGDVGAWLADDRNLMLGAWVDGAPVGMAYGQHLSRPDDRPDMLLLYSIDVSAAHRGRGIGTALVRAFCGQARGAAWVVTNASNEPAMRMYRSAGCARPNTDDVLFVKAPEASS